MNSLLQQMMDVCCTQEEFENSSKMLRFVPTKDAKVMRIASNEIGTFSGVFKNTEIPIAETIRPTAEFSAEELPYYMLLQAYSFFEALGPLHKGKIEIWYDEDDGYHLHVPKAFVGENGIEFENDFQQKTFKKVMDITNGKNVSVFAPDDEIVGKCIVDTKKQSVSLELVIHGEPVQFGVFALFKMPVIKMVVDGSHEIELESSLELIKVPIDAELVKKQQVLYIPKKPEPKVILHPSKNTETKENGQKGSKQISEQKKMMLQ